jgi:hypothetical protein
MLVAGPVMRARHVRANQRSRHRIRGSVLTGRREARQGSEPYSHRHTLWGRATRSRFQLGRVPERRLLFGPPVGGAPSGGSACCPVRRDPDAISTPSRFDLVRDGSRASEPRSLQPCGFRRFPSSTVFGRSAALAACHAGGRGFESRRSRCLHPAWLGAATLSGADERSRSLHVLCRVYRRLSAILPRPPKLDGSRRMEQPWRRNVN